MYKHIFLSVKYFIPVITSFLLGCYSSSTQPKHWASPSMLNAMQLVTLLLIKNSKNCFASETVLSENLEGLYLDPSNACFCLCSCVSDLSPPVLLSLLPFPFSLYLLLSLSVSVYLVCLSGVHHFYVHPTYFPPIPSLAQESLAFPVRFTLIIRISSGPFYWELYHYIIIISCRESGDENVFMFYSLLSRPQLATWLLSLMQVLFTFLNWLLGL